ncbi:response regulator transcription factor [Oxalobacter paraformigenes]|uniref:HTH luxR-type domain-containing protein n=1 Tax=Oxalobacter paraformigenes TaxID=556268 RepID=C3X6Z2_9BURK|nr:response regulator transcription factor [Oxalobacter paraformigenes]EEO26905.1 hypothetical protein OFAG_00058 [Oxalobacter paraformigenes]
MYVIATADEKFETRWNRIIANSSWVDVVGSIAELDRFLNEKPAEVVILDMTLPEARNKGVLKAVTAARKPSRLILAGVSFTPESELAALAAGAVACCSPLMPESECRKILDVVSKKGVWLSSAGIPALMERLKGLSSRSPVSPYPDREPVAAGWAERLNSLTRREHEIARLVATGENNKNIARKLDISERTVKAHLTSIFDKLQIRDRLQLVVYLSGNR